MVPCCYQSQNYKIWKQFTTGNADEWTLLLLLLITKLQNLKAIHNSLTSIMRWRTVVINHKTTKFESNSQRCRPSCRWRGVVINHKTTKFESNSQPKPLLPTLWRSCYQSQNYKIWKQFTTIGWCIFLFVWLLSIAKLQNLKTIHNINV